MIAGPDGTRAVRFGDAEVLRDSARPDAWLVTVDGVPQSYVDLGDPSVLAFDVLRRIGDVVDRLPAGPLAAMHIGGAACTLPRYIASVRPGSAQVVFELDDLLVAFLSDRLDTVAVPGLTVQIADGRAGLAARADGSADLIVLDAFESGQLPAAFTTLEFARDVARVLRGPRTFVANLVDDPDLHFTRRLVATFGSVFDNLLLFADNSDGTGNLVLVATAVDLPLADLAVRAAAARFPARLIADAELRELSAGAEIITAGEQAPSLR